MTWILAADIGGTHSRLLAVNLSEPEGECADIYPSNDYPGVVAILEAFKQEHSIDRIKAACFAVAGPVKDNSAKITNLPWQLNADTIMQESDIAALTLVNDFEGIAHSIPTLHEEELVTLQSGKPESGGTIAILGAGTGLGEAIVKQHNSEQIVIPSEGGHASFAPNDSEELALLDQWMERLGRVTCETFLSGQGLTRIFDFYRDNSPTHPDRILCSRMKEEDPAAVITEYALNRADPVAEKALERFTMIYASQAANLALTCRATGGLYIAGGIAPKIITELQSSAFIDCFNNRQPMQELLTTIPVRVIMKRDAGVRGALNIATEMALQK